MEDLAGSAEEPDYYLVGTRARAFPIKVWSKPSGEREGKPLVISFHGAFDQAKGFPYFSDSFLAVSCRGIGTSMAIADPTMLQFPPLFVSWYAGDAEFDTTEELSRLIRSMVNRLQPSRVIFVSGSSGGHPALVQANRIADSICLLQNPLPVISDYFASQVAAYREICWPDQPPERPLSEFIIDDAATVFAAGQRCKVMIVQNATDPLYPRNLATLSAVLKPQKTLILSEVFAGLRGHKYPMDRIYRFVEALLRAPEVDPFAIADAVLSGGQSLTRESDREVARKLAAAAAN
ncbi:MAG: hypothetical protein ACXWVH_03530 [Caulobacteraceae bacterium]